MSDKRSTENPFESVVIHWRYRPTGDEGEMVTIRGRQDAQGYIDLVSKEKPGSNYDWWLVAI